MKTKSILFTLCLLFPAHGAQQVITPGSAITVAAGRDMINANFTELYGRAFDADITLWAGTTPSANGMALVSAANYAAMRGLLDLEPGTDFLSIAAIAAAYQPLDTDLTLWAGYTPSANGGALVSAADYTAMRALLDLEAGTDFLTPAAIAAAYQGLDADLTDLADGSLTGSKVGTGISGDYITLGTVADARIDAALTRDAEAAAAYQPLNAKLTAVSLLANTAGALTNDGTGIFSYSALSGTNTGDNSANSLYSGLVSNATHTGDVTGATALTIADDAVTYAKIQNVSAASKLLGRGSAAGAGDAEEITVGSGLTMTGTTLSASSGSDPWTYVKVTTEFSTTSATAVDVISDGASAVLGFTPAASTDYEFEALLYVRTPTTATVGVRPGLAWPTGLTNGVAELENPTSATAVSRVFGNINASLLAAVGGLPNITQSYPARIRGHVRAGASPSGLVRVQCASETGGTAVRIEVGSFFKYRSL